MLQLLQHPAYAGNACPFPDLHLPLATSHCVLSVINCEKQPYVLLSVCKKLRGSATAHMDAPAPTDGTDAVGIPVAEHSAVLAWQVRFNHSACCSAQRNRPNLGVTLDHWYVLRILGITRDKQERWPSAAQRRVWPCMWRAMCSDGEVH